MKILLKFLIVTILINHLVCDDSKDSYLDAYIVSQKINNGISDREYVENGGPYPLSQDGSDYNSNTGTENSYSPPKYEYAPPKNVDSYQPTQGKYGPPNESYGPPIDSYGPPKQNYGPYSRPVYGPPQQSYGLPDYISQTTNLMQSYGVPHMFDKFKLDIWTLGKILLKFVIFKKIVSLIGILCLLLFLPSLKNKTLME